MDPQVAILRSQFNRITREFFSQKGYLEVDTPILSPALIPESAIEVFETFFLHPDRKPLPLYLIPSPEVWMKRLLAQGWPSLFQITKSFRNAESIGRIHSPEFTLLEYYTRGANYIASIDITEQYFQFLLDQIPPDFLASDLRVLQPPFQRMQVEEAFQRFAGFSLVPLDREGLLEKAKSLGLTLSEEASWEEAFNQVFVHLVEPNLPQDRPLVLLDYPAEVPCLAKRIPGTPWRERWELYIGGMELANCFTEETDPHEIEAYFAMEGEKKRFSRVPHTLDISFRDMYKIPSMKTIPLCSGVALGVDRLLMCLSGKSSIEGVILFPISDIVLS
ncbi:MAG: hypothetical protein N2442_08925 [Spirochaetes bacterium]|nr:hypothetical protein [Spirochaetota bacterium]